MSPAYHLSLSISNPKISFAFYKQILVEFCEWQVIDEAIEYMGLSDGNFSLWLLIVEKNTKHTFKGVGFHHFAIRVKNRLIVDTIYSFCLENSITVVDKPKLYPEYQPNYYAFYLLDPDGMKLEIVSLE